MMNTKNGRFFLLLWITLISLTGLAFGQVTNVSGRVLRGGHIPVPYANITYTHTGSGQVYVTQADADGNYLIRNLLLSVTEQSVPTSGLSSPNVVTNNGGASINFHILLGQIIDHAAIFNILGQQVVSISLSSRDVTGNQRIASGFWDGRTSSGVPASNGLYFIVLKLDNRQLVLKVVLNRTGNRVGQQPVTELIQRNLTNSIQSLSKSRATIATETSYLVLLEPDSIGMRFQPIHFARLLHDSNNVFIDTVTGLPPQSILFIGNSYTFFNGGIDLHLANLCRNADSLQPVITSNSTFGGYTFELHWQTPSTRDSIRSRRWDVVILQEQSTRPVDDSLLMFQYADSLTRIIRYNGSEAGFFMTWARQNDPPMIEGLASSYNHCGRANGAMVVPVGRAWQLSLTRNPTLTLHISDASHPTVYGTYLTICVFYAALFERSPVGLTYVNDPSISATDRDFLQRIAWETVQIYPPVCTDP